MVQYKIIRTDKADEQLRDIIFYIADDSGSTDIALKYLSKIETSINRLKEYPLSGSVPKYSILRKEGYRILVIERHLAFYKINEKTRTVTIYAIMDGRREYKNLI
jgi:toxin ParE1/3/4